MACLSRDLENHAVGEPEFGSFAEYVEDDRYDVWVLEHKVLMV